MLLPVYAMSEYDYFSKEARASREESYKYAKIFYVLGYTGELNQAGELLIQADKLKAQCKSLKITNMHLVWGLSAGELHFGGVYIREAPQNGTFSAKPAAGRPTEKVLCEPTPARSSFSKNSCTTFLTHSKKPPTGRLFDNEQ